MGDRGITARGGVLHVAFTWQGKTIRRSTRLADTAPNRKYVRQLRGEIKRKIALGVFDLAEYFPEESIETAGSVTFFEFAAHWLQGQSHLATATYESYRKALNGYFLPVIGNLPIDAITHTELLSLVSSALAGKSNKTRNNALTPLRRVFEAAYLDGLIPANPAGRISFAKVQKPLPNPLTLAELNTVLGWIADNAEPVWLNYFETAFFTGLRTSELIALKWSDVDSSRKVLAVQRAKVRKEIKSTKTAAVRHVELHARALTALQRQKALTLLQGEWVFLHPVTNLPVNNDKPPRLVWTEALKGVGLEHRDAYQTRHTYATLALMSGANPMWVARQLGHSTMQMLLTRYGRWIDSADKGAELAKLESTTE